MFCKLFLVLVMVCLSFFDCFGCCSVILLFGLDLWGVGLNWFGGLGWRCLLGDVCELLVWYLCVFCDFGVILSLWSWKWGVFWFFWSFLLLIIVFIVLWVFWCVFVVLLGFMKFGCKVFFVFILIFFCGYVYCIWIFIV